MTAWDGQVFSFFGNAADPGVTRWAVSTGEGRRLLRCDAEPRRLRPPRAAHEGALPRSDDEYLPVVTTAYIHAALIGANMEPNVSGDAPGEIPYASAIFLHRFNLDANGNPLATSGCVSLGLNNLVEVLKGMQPTTMFAIGEPKWLLANS